MFDGPWLWWQCKGGGLWGLPVVCSRLGGEFGGGGGAYQKPLTLPCAVPSVLEWAYPRTAWTLSGVSRSPLLCRPGPPLPLARGWGDPGFVNLTMLFVFQH